MGGPAGEQVDDQVDGQAGDQAGEALLSVSGLSVSFGQLPVLSEVSLVVNRGEIVALLGPSGCGKTTLLRAIAGLQPTDSGRIVLGGSELGGLRPDERGVGLMFQDDVLFPHFDVAGNVEFGLRMSGMEAQSRASRVAQVLDLLELGGYEGRDIATLSGGEAQRVGLARALAPTPALLLLDEPFGSLDRPLRERLVTELRPLLKSQGIAAVVVTHDRSEALALGDRLAVMSEGAMLAIGEPERLWHRSPSVAVARFLGHSNIFELAQLRALANGPGAHDTGAHVQPAEMRGASYVAVRADLIELADSAAAMEIGHSAMPRDSAVSGDSSTPADEVALTLGGSVASCRFAGTHYEVSVNLAGTGGESAGVSGGESGDQKGVGLRMEARSEGALEPGSRVKLCIPPAALLALPA